MEWVETTGSTIEDALDAALDELGVHEDEVEFEVLEEPRAGLFGRLGGNPARIRARVRPISREKPGERNRGRSRPARRGGARSDEQLPGRAEAHADVPLAAPLTTGGARESIAAEMPAGVEVAAGTGRSRRRRRRGGRRRSGNGELGLEPAREEHEMRTTASDDVPVGEQADVADEFMRGLIDAFGLAAEVSVRIDDDVVFVDVDGSDLGLLVGPKGTTLRAIEDLVRTVVQRRTDGHGARIHLDIAGYQAKRRAALEQFAIDLARRVRESGKELALEPMPPSDRKVVHDAIAPIEGVTTVSEGEEPRRRVVVRPV